MINNSDENKSNSSTRSKKSNKSKRSKRSKIEELSDSSNISSENNSTRSSIKSIRVQLTEKEIKMKKIEMLRKLELKQKGYKLTKNMILIPFRRYGYGMLF